MMNFIHEQYEVKITQLKPEKYKTSPFNSSTTAQIPGYYIFIEDENTMRDNSKFLSAVAAYAERIQHSPSRYSQYKISI
jgi:hypothetical protein